MTTTKVPDALKEGKETKKSLKRAQRNNFRYNNDIKYMFVVYLCLNILAFLSQRRARTTKTCYVYAYHL
jgi:hypothetical protein